jgi:lipid A 3-O-deacylase
MTKTMSSIPRSLAAALLLGGCAAAHAVDLRPDSVFVAGGVGERGLLVGSVGVAWDWNWTLQRRAEITGHTELMLNGWRARDFDDGQQGWHQIVVLPLLRMQLDGGRSPWYLEAGIGASWINRLYRTPTKITSTRFNFYDVLGAGYKFGAQRNHELGLRYVHVSNAGLKDPNPGVDFLQLRYGMRF